MPIRLSAATEIRALVESLSAADDVKREGAIARLAVIGPRAVDRLVAAYSAADRPTRLAILRVLEAIGDARAMSIARDALQQGGDLAVTGAAVLRALLNAPAADASAASLDALVATALDRQLERRVRMAAYDALQEMPDDVRSRVAGALESDPDQTIAHLTDAGRETVAEVIWQDALEGGLPDDPAALRDAAQTRVPTAPLGAVQKLVDTIRAREAEPAHAARRKEWESVRGALHQALALRGSRIALYDLRESIAAADTALPGTFISALHLVGDEEALHAIATAHKRAAKDPRWQQQLAAAFDAIVKREKLARKKVAKLLG